MSSDNQVVKPYILYIESATEICSVALACGEELLALAEVSDSNAHSKNLILFVEKVLREAQVDKKSLHAVAFSKGPGSYTGLRIGASTAKSLSYSLEIPLIAISTLESIAMGAWKQHRNENLCFRPMIDARRMEVFTALFDSQMNPLQEVEAKVVGENAFADELAKGPVLFCGNGMPKCKDLLAACQNARFDETPLSAQNMILPALKKFAQQDFENTAYFEPFYLKEYVAVKAGVKGLK